MLNWRNVRLIFLREVRDQLRDRRTLFMIAVLPLLLYPAMGIGMMQLNVLFREQPRVVVVLGADQLPEKPALIEGHRFAKEWFPERADPNRLVVVSDLPAENAEDQDLPEGINAQSLLQQAHAVRDELAKDRKRAGELFGASSLQVLVIVPDGFSKSLTAVDWALRERRDEAQLATGYPRPEIVYNKADEKSQITYHRVTDVFEDWEKSILDGWLQKAALGKEFTHPVLGEPVDVALDEHLAASIWARLFPAMLIIMSVTGAFYPAIDLVAGEKERGTMETLLICPARRSEIVLGKFFTVMAFSCATALLNLASMGFTGRHIASMAPGALAQAGSVSLPPLSAIVWLIVLLVPLAALFSALCLALATFARSSKEGQYYLTPLLMVTLGLTIFCLSPGVELNPRYGLMPVVGPALLLKGLLLSPLHSINLYAYILPVLMTSLAYSALALWWAIDQFQREEVLFREAERFDLRLWLGHLLRAKDPQPSFSEAAFCFMLIMMLQFFSMKFLQQKLQMADESQRAGLMMHLLLVQQLAIIGSPALMMGIMLTTNMEATFGIRWPGWRMLGAAVVLPLLLHPLSIELQARLHWLLGELPAGVKEALAPLSDAEQPLWLVLVAFAVAPAFCEEVAFRGFILRGFSRGGRVKLAICLSSLAFGIMHMIPHQVFNATLVGLVLGTLAIRSRSLLPAIVFHFINNALGVLHGRWSAELKDQLPTNPFVVQIEGALRYEWPTIVLCIALAGPLLYWLARPLWAPRETAGGPLTVPPTTLPTLSVPHGAAAKGV